ncbi:MAG: helix-turn-helix domain-containing protein [Candidatus Paceibacterota bacterium]
MEGSAYYSFDETMEVLGIDENRLKRLVTEGEIRAFRDGGQMVFKKTDINELAERTKRAGHASDDDLVAFP